jgi:hypothetical protein
MSTTLLIILPTLALLAAIAITLVGVIVSVVHRQENFHITKSLLTIIAREASARVLFFILRPVSPLISNERNAELWLVCDAQHPRSSFLFLSIFLRQRGVLTRIVSLSGKRLALAARAEQLKQALERHNRNNQAITLVCFDTAGVVAAWAVQHLALSNHCNKIISIGTPWQGTQMAVFGRAIASVEVKTNSPKLDSIRDLSVSITSIWSPDDPYIVPAQSACRADTDSAEISGTGHLAMLFSARVMRAVYTASQKR